VLLVNCWICHKEIEKGQHTSLFNQAVSMPLLNFFVANPAINQQYQQLYLFNQQYQQLSELAIIL